MTTLTQEHEKLRQENQRKALSEEYHHLNAIYGIGSRGWNDIHCNFSRYAFCPANQPGLIAEYLIWEDFVKRAKEVNFVYYWGIDEFLKQYSFAVHNRVKIDKED